MQPLACIGVVLTEMPGLMKEVVSNAINAAPDITIVDVANTQADLRAALARRDCTVIVTALAADEQVPPMCRDAFFGDADPAIVALSADGTFVRSYDRTEARHVAIHQLLDVIRGVRRKGDIPTSS